MGENKFISGRSNFDFIVKLARQSIRHFGDKQFALHLFGFLKKVSLSEMDNKLFTQGRPQKNLLKLIFYSSSMKMQFIWLE